MHQNIAQGLASLGRGPDTMLVHMSPGEVSSLQRLAMSHGGSLTTNPHTGLPEAGFLSSLLPLAIGIAAPELLPATMVESLGGAATVGALAGGVTGGIQAYAQGTNPLLGAGLGALGGYGGGQFASGLSNLGAEASQELANETARNAALEKLGITGADKGEALTQWLQQTAPLDFAPGEPTVSLPNTIDPDKLAQYQQALKDAYVPPPSASPQELFTSGAKQLFAQPADTLSRIGGGMGKTALLGAGIPLAMGLMSRQSTLPANMAASSPVQFYNTRYSPGVVNPYRNIPGQPYFLGQGYAPGTFAPTAMLADGGIIDLLQGNYPGAKIPKRMAEGGDVNDAKDYYSSLLSGRTSLYPQPASSDAMNQYLANLNKSLQYTPPATPLVSPSPIPQSTSGGWSYDPASQTFNQAQPVQAAPVAAPEPVYIRPEYTGAAGGFAEGGIAGLGEYAAGGTLLRGPGDGMSDSIPAVIKGEKPQRAALADGEFVVPADVVSHLGNGSTDAGAKKLYSMMDKVRRARTGNPKQGRQINPDKFMPA